MAGSSESDCSQFDEGGDAGERLTAQRDADGRSVFETGPFAGMRTESRSRKRAAFPAVRSTDFEGQQRFQRDARPFVRKARDVAGRGPPEQFTCKEERRGDARFLRRCCPLLAESGKRGSPSIKRESESEREIGEAHSYFISVFLSVSFAFERSWMIGSDGGGEGGIKAYRVRSQRFPQDPDMTGAVRAGADRAGRPGRGVCYRARPLRLVTGERELREAATYCIDSPADPGDGVTTWRRGAQDNELFARSSRALRWQYEPAV